jgi:hypothetical protein
MNTGQALELALAVLACAAVAFGLVKGRAARPAAAASLALLGLALAVVWLGDFGEGSRGARHVITLVAAVLAVGGGGLVTTQVFALVDADATSVRSAGDVLRGGAWIGALERLAVFVTLLAGWGPGVAIVLAVKGLGRYPELRNEEDTGAAERFIIGTFTSVLWAAACAGLTVLALTN